MKNKKLLTCFHKNSLLSDARLVFDDEKSSEAFKGSEAADEQPEVGEAVGKGDVKKFEKKGRMLTDASMPRSTELAKGPKKNPQQVLKWCIEVDKFFMKSVDRNFYKGKEEKYEENMIAEGEKVSVVKPGVEKYKDAYKNPTKPNVPTPNVLAEYMVNEVYKKVGSRFTNQMGDTNPKRADDLYDYIYEKEDEDSWSKRAAKVEDWFSAAQTAIKKGQAV